MVKEVTRGAGRCRWPDRPGAELARRAAARGAGSRPLIWLDAHDALGEPSRGVRPENARAGTPDHRRAARAACCDPLLDGLATDRLAHRALDAAADDPLLDALATDRLAHRALDAAADDPLLDALATHRLANCPLHLPLRSSGGGHSKPPFRAHPSAATCASRARVPEGPDREVAPKKDAPRAQLTLHAMHDATKFERTDLCRNTSPQEGVPRNVGMTRAPSVR